jgi:trigger factor
VTTQDVQATEIKTKNLTFSVHRKPGCLVELQLHASPTLVHAAREKAIKAVGKEVAVPGFRKGRAPDALIVKSAPAEIDKKWQATIAQAAFEESLPASNVPLLKEGKVSFEMKKHALDKGAELTLTFETDPEVPTVDPKQFHLKAVEKIVVDDEKVEQVLRQVQLFFAEWKEVFDRPIQEGDFVLVDLDVIEQDPPQRVFTGIRFEVTSKSTAKWMLDMIVGKKTGDVVEGMSIPDEKASEEEKASLTPKKVRVTIKATEEAIPPAVDDAFAKQLGVDKAEELKPALTRLLTRQSDQSVRAKHRAEADEFLLSKYEFELPNTLIEKEVQLRMRMLMADKEFQNHWEALSVDDKRNMLTTLYEQSKKAVRMFYLCRKILEDAKISISAKDVPPPLSSPLEALLIHQKVIDPLQDPNMHEAEVVSRLLLEKAEDYLIDNAGLPLV